MTRSPDPESRDRDLRRLQRQVRVLQAFCAALAALLAAAPLLGWRASPAEVLRVRGLIIEDAAGRERILLGAPIPDAAHRIRTDPAKAEQAWGDRYPDMEWFTRLAHSTNGLLILDENGHDRIAIGDPCPDPNIGKRIAPSVGVTINDQEGFERSGLGHFPKLDRVGFGLDRRGGEGLNLFLMEDGAAGVLIRDPTGKQRTFLGHAGADHFVTGLPRELHGLLLGDADGPRLVLDGAGETPHLDIRDREGTGVHRFPAK